MTTREYIHLVGNFRPDVLERWKQFAELTNRDIKYTTAEELAAFQAQPRGGPIIVMDEHGLNELVL